MDSVLIVDDNKLAVDIINDLLTAWGYRTKICGNSTEVFESVADFKPDVILLDIMLPGMNGYAICNKLKTDPETRAIPIIMLTVLNDMEDRIQAYNMGADAFLSKPVKYPELKNRVEWAVRYKKSLNNMESRDMVVRTLMNVLQAADPAAYRHSADLASYCERVAKVLCVVDESLDQLVLGACLHDIGRIVTQDPRGHIQTGLKLIEPLNMRVWLAPYIRSHHEKLNGTGYPDGLTAADMPVNLKILITVNRFLELTDERGSETAALAQLTEECEKGDWCERVLAALKQAIKDADFKKKLIAK